MIDLETLRQELSSVRQKLSTKPTLHVAVAELEDFEDQLLAEHALDLVERALTGDRVRTRTKAVEDGGTLQDVLALTELALAALKRQSRVSISDPSQEPYLTTIVSNAFWKSTTVKVGVSALGLAFAIVLALFTYGTVNILDRANAAFEVLSDARTKLKEAEDLKGEVDTRIETFGNAVRFQEDRLAANDRRLDKLEQDFKQEAEDLRERLQKEYGAALIAIQDAPSRLDQAVQRQIEPTTQLIATRLSQIELGHEPINGIPESAVI